MYHQRYADSPIVNAYIPTRRGDPYFQDMYLWVPVQRGRSTVSQFYTDMLRAIDRGAARISTSPSGSRAGSTWALAIDRQDVNNDRRIIRQFQNDIHESQQYAASVNAEWERQSARQNGAPNGHGNGSNGHSNGRSNGYGNDRSNGYGNGRSNGYGGSNGYFNGYSNGEGGRGHGGGRQGVNGYGRGYN